MVDGIVLRLSNAIVSAVLISILVAISNVVGDWMSSDMVGVGAISMLTISVASEPTA